MNVCMACTEVIDPVGGCLVHPTCELDPNIVTDELFDLISESMTNQPRSLQRRIGPSEIGVECDRRIAYRLAGTEAVNDRGPAWKPYVGTSLHEQFANTIAKEEINRFNNDVEIPRWRVEERVTVGNIGNTAITGSCDLFDQHTGLVLDWKFTTKNMIRTKYKPHGPGEQYRVQAHLYGRGFVNAGHIVRNVAIVFMTRDGEFTDRYVWTEPYDEQVALDALARATSIQNSLEALGSEFTIEAMPTSASSCQWCPFYAKGSTDLTEACPGHAVEEKPLPTLEEMLK